MSKFLFGFRIKIATALVVMVAFQIAAAWGIQQIVICPTHGVQAHWTGARKTVFSKNNQRRTYCEYSHPLKDLSGVDKFWQDCTE
jgi:hypothetical protein